jgi:hypothetical protein
MPTVVVVRRTTRLSGSVPSGRIVWVVAYAALTFREIFAAAASGH